MRNKLDNFLLGLLWILISTLGLCFWFNIQFGFNLLSASHWQHLSYMQATRAPVSAGFYLSLIIGVFFIIFGLYLLIRPKFREIPLPSHTSDTQEQQPARIQTVMTSDEFALSRPRRLMAANVEHGHMPLHAPTAPVTSDTNTQNASEPDTSTSELQNIFESVGYTVKKSPRINGYQTALMAIGTNENVWLGAVGIETTTLQSIIDTIQQIFSDTLDDIEITIHGFVIAAPDASNAPSDILTFDNNNQLREYMHQHPNPPSDPDMAENFNAFSEYISTVIDYLGHL